MPQVAASVAELARLPEFRQALDWFRREKTWINEQHLSLCRVPAATFLEAKRAAWIEEQFRRLGWDARTDRAGNVIASRPNSADRPSIAVTAHLDTVLAPRLADDISVASNGRFLGPGVSDNGAGLAALLALAGVWNELPRFADLWDDAPFAPILVANVGEEGEGNLSGMRYLCNASQSTLPKAFVILDGPGHEHITSRALASRRFELFVQGPGGHSWSDHGTGNPVHALSRTVTLFTDQLAASQASSQNGAVKDHPAVRSSYNFGLTQGGSSINSIPVEAWAKVDLRSEDAGKMDEMSTLLLRSLEQAVGVENGRVSLAGARVSARIKEIGSRPGGELPDHAPLLDSIRAVDSFLGIKSYLDRSSTDANIPLSMGLPAIAIGAGGQGGGAHTPGEWYHPDGREIGLRRILLILGMLLTQGA